MRQDLRDFGVADVTFPHPFFGELSAIEWLCLIGGHEQRHLKQIKRVMAEKE
jgi:hypothetical protein